ncbi:hypothetical protein M0804_009676 [Polistes exclamans]|nr:hypothetical protein M0804_009676 [Polistes exclamans]
MDYAIVKIYPFYKKGYSVSFTAKQISGIYRSFEKCVHIVEFWFDKFEEEDFNLDEMCYRVSIFNLDINILKDFVIRHPHLNIDTVAGIFRRTTNRILETLENLGFIRYKSKWVQMPLYEE